MACVANYVPVTGSMKVSRDTLNSMNAWRFLDLKTYRLLLKLLEFIFTVSNSNQFYQFVLLYQ
jgi:hypothetical protein